MDRKTEGKRRGTTWIWILAVSAVIIALLYWEQTALLYVLGTVGVSALLLVVAMADLSHAKKPIAAAPVPADDAAALGSGIDVIAPAAPRTTFGARTGKKRRT
ncbi:MAG: hypothetical protein H7Y30_12935 [Pyrinomonadaceae bacterium]|nr:hypothetical protein [Pyrinomonadaceae bacterium]